MKKTKTRKKKIGKTRQVLPIAAEERWSAETGEEALEEEEEEEATDKRKVKKKT